MRLHFDPATHRYTIDDAEIPSVTQVLPYDYDNFDPYFRDRGAAVHRMIYLHNMGKEEEIYTDPNVLPFLDDESTEGYFRSYLCAPKLMYQNMVLDYKTGGKHPATDLQVAAYQMLVREGVTEEGVSLWKLARGGEMILHETHLFCPTYRYGGTVDYIYLDGQGAIKGMVMYLQKDGTKPKVEEVKDIRKNQQFFLAFLTTWKWRKEKGLL